jgi:UDP-N-acetylmuramoylalanine--D-glutamate ligase
MNILLLGYGKEGKSAEKYFKSKGDNVDIVENITKEEAATRDYSSYNMILRSPSLPPFESPILTSVTKYFFDYCPCPIIGVTATKGKGTTCSFIKSILDSLGEDAYLVGNIGNPSIDILDELKSTSVVIYEMSSFQLWDLTKSPHVAVVGTIEPDHLNVHNGFDDYTNAKANICRYQSADDFCIYFKNNPDSVKIAKNGIGKKITYPYNVPEDILNAVVLPGDHNKDNAIAAIAAVASYKGLSPEEFITKYPAEIKSGLSNFKGLPHRLEFVRKIGNVSYYDDNFSTNPASTRVAVNAFPDDNVIIIAGGRDKTDNEDLPEIYEVLKSENIKHIILMGESGHELYSRYQDPRFTLVEPLEDAVNSAVDFAEKYDHAVVLMSPSAASFDMFENVYDRGDQYKKLVNNL